MNKFKEEKKPTTMEIMYGGTITTLVEEVKTHLEKIANKQLFAEIYGEKKENPFWRISKEEKSRGIICSIFYDKTLREVSFHCTHENCNDEIYNQLKRQLQEKTQKLGLKLKEINPKK